MSSFCMTIFVSSKMANRAIVAFQILPYGHKPGFTPVNLHMIQRLISKAGQFVFYKFKSF